jgi:hypothetical protein
MNKIQKVRAKLYRTASFRRELADRLGLNGTAVHVTSCVDSLLEARRLPSSCAATSRAAAMDAALVLIAVGSLQTDAKAVLHLTERLCAMKLSTVIDTSGTVEREIPIAAETDFVTDVSMLFEEYWAAPKGAFLEGLCHTVFFTRIGDTPAEDSAMLLRFSAKRRQIYSATSLLTAGSDGSPCRTTRGGMTLMPASIANLAELMRDDLKGSAAAIRA